VLKSSKAKIKPLSWNCRRQKIRDFNASKDRLTAVKSLTPQQLHEIKKYSIVDLNYRQGNPENICSVIAQTARMSKRYHKTYFKLFFKQHVVWVEIDIRTI